MGGPIDIKQKGWRSVIYDNDPDLLMTKVKRQDDWTVTGVTLDVHVLLTRLVRFQPWSVDFPHFGGILTLSKAGQIWVSRHFLGNQCWCILTTFRTDQILVMVC